ncbi:MAG TPA: hypothetical protein PK985_06815, partial [Bacillota bacterium]|nr:hypothetical protein [Bacillota bacterium]
SIYLQLQHSHIHFSILLLKMCQDLRADSRPSSKQPPLARSCPQPILVPYNTITLGIVKEKVYSTNRILN